VVDLATGYGGYISDSSTSLGGSAPSANLVLRVPAAKFDSVMSSLSRLGKVTSEDMSGKDVTTQVVDNNAQLQTLQDEAVAARTLLTRATSIGDILTIQDQAFALQGQIQEITAQQAALSDEIDYATVTVGLTTAAAPAPIPKPRSTLQRTWHSATHNSAAVLRGLVLAVGWLAPLLVIGALAGLPALWWYKRRREPRAPLSAE
jgi:hypothetical protein